MLTSELFESTKSFAPKAHERIFMERHSAERRAALHSAIHVLYASRSGDRLFYGHRRHRLLAKYLESPAGWTRLERLWDFMYRRGPWKAEEDARLRRELDAEAARLESTRLQVLRQIQAEKSALTRYQDDRRDALHDLGTAERNIKAAESSLATRQGDLAAVEASLAALGRTPAADLAAAS